VKRKVNAIWDNFGVVLYNYCIFHTANVDSEEPYYSTANTGQQDTMQSYDLEESYYSTVNTGQPDAIEMKENDAYQRPQPTQQEITVEENPAYDVTGQYCT